MRRYCHRLSRVTIVITVIAGVIIVIIIVGIIAAIAVVISVVIIVVITVVLIDVIILILICNRFRNWPWGDNWILCDQLAMVAAITDDKAVVSLNGNGNGNC